MRLLQAASLADNVDAEVEYAIALFNGTGTPKNQAAGGGAVAQGRQAKQPDRPKPARARAGDGTGAPMDKVEALKWHIDRQNRRQG